MKQRADASACTLLRGVLGSPLIAFIALTQGGAAQEVQAPDRIRAALLHDGKLLCLREDGTLRAWNAETGRVDPDAALTAPPQPARCLASDGTSLWCASRSAAWSWSRESHAWKKGDDFDAHREDVLGLALIGGAPLVVLEKSVLSLADGRAFAVPKGEGQHGKERPLELGALNVSGSSIWIGTDNGEFGGELFRLDVCSGAWARFSDDYHDVTSITLAASQEVVVSWSMGHRGNEAVVCVHAPDASVKSAGPELEDAYLQAVAWSPFDTTLYGVDAQHLISIQDGQPKKIALLDGDLPPDMRRVVDSRNGIVAILPKARRSLLVVPREGVPWRWHQGSLERLHVD